MKSCLVAAAAVVVVSVQCSPAAAQQQSADNPCKTSKKRGGFGGFLGTVGGDTIARQLQKVGVPVSAGAQNTLNAALTDLFACKLRPDERDRAAGATATVVEMPVGATQTWTSPSRPGVTGSTSVIAQTNAADGSVCKDVRDVATIDGEETTVVKTMCRQPGGSGFVLRPKAAA